MERPLFSETLSSRRRQLGFSTTQASRVLRLKEDVLIAFEEGDFAAMPKSGYAQGMLSSYARYLGLDAAQIVEMYTDELEQWRHETGGHAANSARGGLSAAVGQPYVASRGLLPTSGGPAGDMGSFATTRVRTRRTDSTDPDMPEYPSYDARGYEPRGYEPSGYGQTRPYTARAPERRVRRSSDGRGYNDIQTRDIGPRDYEDDLRIGRDAESYRAASTRRGRRSSRSGSRADRPRVRRNSSGRGSSSRSRTQRSSSRGGRQSRTAYPAPMQSLVVVVAAIAVIAVILVIAVSSCVSKNFNTTRTVPVSTATAGDATTQRNDTASQPTTDDFSTTTSDTDSGSNRSSSTKTSARDISVSISVADGAVTWLEVECDGKSEVAQTVTGPWQHTYAVQESLTVQAGDTTAVEVLQDGKQVQFDSMASGIGTIRIEGSGRTKTSRSSKETTDSADTEEYADDEDSESQGAASERTSSAHSSSGTSSARMGNNAQDDEQTQDSSDNDSSTEYGDDEYDDTEY